MKQNFLLKVQNTNKSCNTFKKLAVRNLCQKDIDGFPEGLQILF